MKIAEKILVSNPLGLHLRNAARLVLIVDRYKCEVEIQNGSRRANARSILGLIALGIARGAELEISVEGNDAEELLDAVRDFFEKDF